MAAAAEVGRRMKVAHALLRAASTLVSALGLISALQAATFYVTVAGLGGEPDYEQRFASEAQEIDKLVHASGSDAKVTTLYGAQATKAAVQERARASRARCQARATPSC